MALTHRSAGKPNNERLEFLGDAIIGFLVAEFLFQRFPDADEGQLTRTRASLVNRETLAAMARELELGSAIALGEGEQKSGGWRRDSILANALEAVLAAIYLDGGIEAARQSLVHICIIHRFIAAVVKSSSKEKTNIGHDLLRKINAKAIFLTPLPQAIIRNIWRIRVCRIRKRNNLIKFIEIAIIAKEKEF